MSIALFVLFWQLVIASTANAANRANPENASAVAAAQAVWGAYFTDCNGRTFAPSYNAYSKNSVWEYKDKENIDIQANQLTNLDHTNNIEWQGKLIRAYAFTRAKDTTKTNTTWLNWIAYTSLGTDPFPMTLYLKEQNGQWLVKMPTGQAIRGGHFSQALYYPVESMTNEMTSWRVSCGDAIGNEVSPPADSGNDIQAPITDNEALATARSMWDAFFFICDGRSFSRSFPYTNTPNRLQEYKDRQQDKAIAYRLQDVDRLNQVQWKGVVQTAFKYTRMRDNSRKPSKWPDWSSFEKSGYSDAFPYVLPLTKTNGQWFVSVKNGLYAPGEKWGPGGIYTVTAEIDEIKSWHATCDTASAFLTP